MTVKEIVKDLLKYKMITEEAAVVLLRAEADAIAYRMNSTNSTYTQDDLGMWVTNTTADIKLR
jgi:hypothetical protein